MNVPQPVQAPLTKSATFLVLTITDPSSPSSLKTIRSALASIEDLSKNVSIRDLNSNFSCTVGIGSTAWDLLVPSSSNLPKPAELHPFRPVHGQRHSAPATPGDLLFHIRSDRRDICFEFESQLLRLLGGGDGHAVTVQDDTQGFRYFDARDLLGFVDGTANPAASALPEAVLIAQGDDHEACVGGSYVVVQKYVHDMPSWRALSTSDQEAIIGRTKADNIELDDQPPGKQQPHKTLTTIEDEHGNEHGIMRDNMPFGSPASGVFGTYFIGYSRRLWVVEKMLERMFVGDPPGKHDRILDFSRALTGSTFYVPPNWVLGKLDED
ncbi:Dyp-type peroxidase [Trichoderma citrinoviride]|uniref:Dyp-type peroxidase n=1 Tax=Trichoderma citrinoviride TaxID=58853 RepID=A0A2T4BEP8_9HYPO|nr:Dyp-type peroxidase [Trichoderma citrinoviride]PTB67814.1 Dyp-type peroxidase [Trichoderma citrinoviride]